MTQVARITSLFPVLLVALWACGDRGPKAPLYSCNAADSTCNTKVYTVVLRDSVGDAGGFTDEIAKEYQFTTVNRWNGSMKGFSGELSDRTVDKLRHNPRVAYIQQGDLSRSYGTR
jgi:hypothetical protein